MGQIPVQMSKLQEKVPTFQRIIVSLRKLFDLKSNLIVKIKVLIKCIGI